MNPIIKQIKAEMQDVVENNILRFWLDKMQDHERGGFYGRMTVKFVMKQKKDAFSTLVSYGRFQQLIAYFIIRNTLQRLPVPRIISSRISLTPNTVVLIGVSIAMVTRSIPRSSSMLSVSLSMV